MFCGSILDMFNKEKDILREISEKLSADMRILKVIAYGSMVRGDYTADSDMDVLIVVDKKDREMKDKIIDIFYSYELQTGISFSLVILSLEEFEFSRKSVFTENIKKEGIVFYDSQYRREKVAV